MDNHTILISGASSDLAKPMIQRLLLDESIKSFVFLSRKATSFKDSRIKEIFIDFSQIELFSLLEKQLLEFNISHYLQYHGTVDKKDTLEEYNYDEFQNIQNVNFVSVVSIVKAILGNMVRNNFGRIFLMSTASASFGGGFNSFSYGLSKNSIEFLVKYLSKNYAKNNILTNAVAPGFIDTRFHRISLSKNEKEMYERSLTVKLGRSGSAQELVDISYSLTFQNSFTTGQILRIDGGDF